MVAAPVQAPHLADQPAQQAGGQIAAALGRGQHRLHQPVRGGLAAPDDGPRAALDDVQQLVLPDRPHDEDHPHISAAHDPPQPGERALVEDVLDEHDHGGGPGVRAEVDLRVAAQLTDAPSWLFGSGAVTATRTRPTVGTGAMTAGCVLGKRFPLPCPVRDCAVDHAAGKGGAASARTT